MKLKIPVLERCCFCLPLRHGLIAWGVFKMIADAFLITVILISLIRVVMMAKVLGPDDDVIFLISYEVIVPVTVFAVLLVDFEVTLMFVCGGLEKNMKLTEVFYFISIAMWLFSLVVTATFMVVAIQSADSLEAALPSYFMNLVVQTYFLILLRSEIIKLRNIDEPQDNAAEAQSTKKCEEILEGEESGKEVV